ncbi:OX-2 membrane glycoprotein isoform X1 [Macaca thibetana thibetana]|uniref:OX-2 membrane glycoprotein isoform X1 n=3 Tax=Macaca fascicularis TaxID=9541 RepID=UPI0003ABC678|nr:OX-2 membrane glycoprotein isoform X1 [Macaca fascicularis]XP_050634830.1 OX-2 membrane glycoprotein isoform X1 [Macaca thibetana thibetana]
MERLVIRMPFCHLSTYSLVWGMAAVVLCAAQGKEAQFPCLEPSRHNFWVQVVTQDEREQLYTPASLRCSLQNAQEVLIVTWQKKKAVSPENMVTFSENHGVVIQPAYKDKINITQLGLQNTTITFWNITLEDEGCYMCLFNTFGSGKISGTACLTVYVQPIVSLHYKYSEDHLNITCSATARPAPMIFWKVPRSGFENSTVTQSHPNGTTSVTSILHVKDPKNQVGKEVICQVLHLGTVTDFKQTFDKGYWFSVPLLLSIVSLVILLVLISILLYWKRHRNQDRASCIYQGLNKC